jgi:hypothetical protein
MGWIWNPHRRQFTRSVQFGQVNRVASVGFNPIAGLARNQRRGDYDAFVPGFALGSTKRRHAVLTMSCELELLLGRPYDLPGCAASADP